MSFAGIEAGRAFVEFLIKDDKLDSGLLKVADKLKGVGKAGMLATAPLIATFLAAATIFASTGGALDDLHRRTGLSVESLSELSYAAQVSGTDMGVVEKACKELQKNGISPLEFDKIAEDLAAIPDHTARAQKAIEVFGSKAGVALLPLLEDLPQLRAEARQLGIVMSAEDSAAADKLGDAFDASKMQLMALMSQIGAAIAGPLTDFLVWSQNIVASTIQWVHENPRLVRTIAAVALAIAACSAAAIGFGVVLTILTLHPIVLALTLIAAAIVGIAAYFGLASDGAKDFKKQLDGVSLPGVKGGAPLQQQAANVQKQLQAASVSIGGSVAGPISSQVAASAGSDVARESTELIALSTQQVVALEQILYVLRGMPKGLSTAWI